MSEILKRLIEIKKEIGHLEKKSKGIHGSLCRSIYDTYLASHDPFVEHGILSSCEGLVDGNMKWTFYCAEDGSSFSTTIPMVNSIDSFFDAGNAISYSHKYAITSMLGLPDESVNQNDPDTNSPQDETKQPVDKKPLPTPKENSPVKLTDKAWLYQKMIEYKINPDYHNQIYIWTFDDAKSGNQGIMAMAKSIGEPTFKKLIDGFSDKAKQEAMDETV